MESFTIELVPNASAQLFPDNTLSSLTNFFTRTTESGRSMGGCNFRKILPINVPKCQGKNFMFFDQKLSMLSKFYYLEPDLYPSITDIVEAMNNLFAENQNHSEICITVKVTRRTQRVRIHLANEKSGLAFFITGLGHIFGKNVGNAFGKGARTSKHFGGKGPHKPEFA